MSVSVLPLRVSKRHGKSRVGEVALLLFQIARRLFLLILAILLEISLDVLRAVRGILGRKVQYLFLLPLPLFSVRDRKRSWALRSVSRGVRYLQAHYAGEKSAKGFTYKEVLLLEQLQVRSARCMKLGISAQRISVAAWRL